MLDAQIDCPNCGSDNTFPTPETAYDRFCSHCGHSWDIRPAEWLIDDE